MRWHLSQPFKVAVAVLAGWAIVLVSCEFTLPPLMEGLIFGDDRSADSVFNERVQTAFPMGLPEAELLRKLEKQASNAVRGAAGAEEYAKVSHTAPTGLSFGKPTKRAHWRKSKEEDGSSPFDWPLAPHAPVRRLGRALAMTQRNQERALINVLGLRFA